MPVCIILIPALLKIVVPDTRREQKTPAGTLKNIRPCIFFNCEICISQISFLCGITAIHGGTEPALLQIGGADTRREQKLTAGMLKSVHPCTLFNVEFLLRKNVAAAYNPGHPCPS